MSSYGEAFEAAGAVIHDQEWFGSWQGEALFDVTYEGKRGILAVGYGSCSGCDSYEAEFGYGSDDHCPEHWAEADRAACPDCATAKASYDERLVAFGRDYLNGVMNDDELDRYIDQLREQTDWDYDAQAQLDWLQKTVAGWPLTN